mgnify:FL=1
MVFALVFISSYLFGYGQMWEIEWEKQMGNSKMDMFADVIEDFNDGFTVLGSTQTEDRKDQDFWLVRFDEDGNTLWSKTYGTPNHDFPLKLAQFPEGGYLLSGKTWNAENKFQAYILKTDSQGNEIWQKDIGDQNYNCVEDIIVMDNSSFIISGTKGPEDNHGNIWFANFNTDGDLIWEKTFGETKMACSESLKKLPDGGFVMAGQISEKGIPDSDLWVFRFDKNGEKIWDKQISSPGINIWPECVCCSPDSNLVVIGWHGTCMNDINSEDPVFDFDLFLAKMSPQGEILWTKNIDSEGSEGGNAVVVRPNGNILMAGKKETSFLGKIGPWLLLSDENGTILNELLLPFKFNGDQAADIINTADGGFVVIGPGPVELNITRSDGWIKKFKAF